MPRWFRWFWVALAGLGCAGCAGMLAFLGFFAGLGAWMGVAGEPTPASAAERAALLTIDDVAPRLPGATIDRAREKAERTRHPDGSVELNYAYEADAVYVACIATLEPQASDAVLTYNAQILGEGIGTRAQDADGHLDRVEADAGLNWGDASRFVEWRYDGTPIGFGYTGRSGRRVWYGVFVGAGVDPDVARALVEPKLTAFDGLD